MVTQYPLEIYIAIGILILLDIASGISQAIFNKTMDSKILRSGMFHKLSYVFALVLALMLEYSCKYLELGLEPTIFVPLAIYIILTEAVSILENLTRINPDLLDSPLFKILSGNQKRRADDKDEQDTDIH